MVTYDAVTANVMHPIPGRYAGYTRLSKAERTSRLATLLDGLQPKVVFAQEVFPEFLEAMESRGFVVVEAHPEGDGTTRRRTELQKRNSRPWPLRTLAGFSHLKFAFTGLAVFFRPHVLSLLSARFLRFADSAQANLGQSKSGVLRTDGLQVVKLLDRRTGRGFIVINTHLESYSQSFRRAQFRELIKEVRGLRKHHPQSIIQIAGDFNWEQKLFNLKMANHLKAISTTWQPDEWCTHVGEQQLLHRYDGIHTLLPRSLQLAAKQSRTINTGVLSDHNFVALHLSVKSSPRWP
jgi:hypothetical protein